MEAGCDFIEKDAVTLEDALLRISKRFSK